MSDLELKQILDIAVEVDKLRQEQRRSRFRYHTPIPRITQAQLNDFVRICRDRVDAAIIIAPILFGNEFDWMSRDTARRMIDLLKALPELPTPIGVTRRKPGRGGKQR